MDTRHAMWTSRNIMIWSAIGGTIYLLGRYGYRAVTNVIRNKSMLSQCPYSQLLRLIFWGPSVTLDSLECHVASTECECEKLLETLMRQAGTDGFLGFDCEWTDNFPVALVQLSTRSGFCVIIHLSKISTFPTALKNLLEDDTVLKVGVGSFHDAQRLFRDYEVDTRGTFDLRYLAPFRPKMGLAALTQDHLNMTLDKSLQVRHSNWAADTLTENQLRYAGQDAFAGALLFEKLMADMLNKAGSKLSMNPRSFIAQYIDVNYKGPNYNREKNTTGSDQRHSNKTTDEFPNTGSKPKEFKAFRAYTPRKSPLYSNCKMLAPDGEVLCTCSRKKADWYIAQNLARVVCSEPYRIQLLFEPAKRFNSASGLYYVQDKINQCVVCGKKDSHLRKNVVPHEYRRHFPDAMKKHISHDILPLCKQCHLRSNMSDVTLRQKLAMQCNAKISQGNDVKATEDSRLKKLRSAARALLHGGSQIAEYRRNELHDILKEELPYYEERLTAKPLEEGEEETTSLQGLPMTELVQKLQNIDISVPNPNYIPHGLKVVENFAKDGIPGLMRLETIWREHFINVMKPEFLPALWSVTHYHQDERNFEEDETFKEKMKMVEGIEKKLSL